MLLSSGGSSAPIGAAASYTLSGRLWSVHEVRTDMDDIIIVALAPFYTMGVAMTGYACYAIAHKAARMDQSATETQMTETTSPASTQQK